MQQLILQPTQQKKVQSSIWNQFQQFATLIHYPCQVYPRVSTPGQRNNVSAEMQLDRRFALFCGWSDDDKMIIVEKDDLGVSGQLRMDERLAFVKMLRNIASGRIKAVIVANISRFFRRKWNDEAEKFMQICDTYGVKVIIPNAQRTAIKSVYDFSKSSDIQQFRRECEEAWKYLENHVYGTMLAAQDVLGQIGRWGGWNLPPGYIVDRREKIDGELNPNYRLYIPYQPHAEILDRLHDRYWELNFNTMALLREIARREYLFPAFEPWVDKEFHTKLCLTRVLDDRGKIKGYTITSDHGLRSVLSNVMSIGYCMWKGELVSTENHEAIIDYNKFAMSYNHISATRLDGTPNEWVLGRRSSYAKKHNPAYAAILDGKLQASDPGYRINQCPKLMKQKERPTKIERYYGFFKRRRSEGFASKYMILSNDVDRIFLDHFIMRLQQADEFENFLDAEKAELQTQAQMLLDLDVQIDAARKALALKKAYLKSGKIKNLDLLEELDADYTIQQEDLARMERQRERISSSKTPAQQRRSYKQMMREAGTCWNEVVTPDELPLMIEAFVDTIVIEPLSPHFYAMRIQWSDPEWGIDELTCYRDGSPSIRWTTEELDILRDRYEKSPMEELFQLLPRRNYVSQQRQAEVLGLRRQYQFCPRHLPKAFCLQDWEIMQQCGVTEEELLISKGGRLVTLAFANGRIFFELELEPGQEWQTCGELIFEHGQQVMEPAYGHRTSEQLVEPLSELDELQEQWLRSSPKLLTPNEHVYRAYRQAIEDMGALRIYDLDVSAEEWVPAAGVPWFVTLFGRDSLIISLQNMSVSTGFARGALKWLADYQAKERDDYRDAQPGKILHEMRFGELAHFSKIPHTPYYGTADATILYLIVLSETYRWTGDVNLLKQYREVAEGCLNWIDQYGDLDGDGFQEYKTFSSLGYENVNWKDSGDAVVYADGSQVKQPKSTCELQGYVYDAKVRMAEIFQALGDEARAQTLLQEAETLKRRFHEVYWMEDEGCYAYGQDGHKKLITSIASNVGHCLWSGIADQDKAERTAKRLLQEDMWSGWGIRTLSSKNPAYNPYSYHLGSVWPHDNGIIAAGFKRYGLANEANQVTRAMFDAARRFEAYRLPEIFAGLKRKGQTSDFPALYPPGANIPQGWASGSVFQMVQTMLGLRADAPNKRLYVNPTLPEWFSEVVLRNLRVGPCTFTLHFWREGERSRWEVVNMTVDSGVAQEDVIQVMDELAVASSRS